MALLKQWNGTNWIEVAIETAPVLVHDTPQDGAATAAISSNWAFDLAATVPHLVAVPATANAAGMAGQMAYASGFLYICIAENTWQRATLATW